ncbi:MAG: CoB--CoM heterodisulfide reductase iron-sulfur subunit A family protein [Candidatus Thermoplasmatota archaeon]|nr:CoB--CoM heterodisulfide reductase iron-sulfur subunit A family protein [Candidatus Thermoplasmatota archaeon]
MSGIGVFICHCGSNIAGTVDVDELTEYASDLNGVTFATNYKYMCSDPGQELIKDSVEEQDLDSVVVAACSPRMHEETFQAVVEDAGLNPYRFQMANIREQCSWVHSDDMEKATEKAKHLVEMSVEKSRLSEDLEKTEVDVNSDALVIGGGIAGIQSALDLADQGKKVYLVEREPSIGGKMAQLDKTFPTLDCSSCILTPKMTDVARNPNIELLTYSEVEEVDGSVGDFEVKVKKKATYVDWDKCTACGDCAEACRRSGNVEDEFNEGLDNRGAIYTPFPQAVPAAYTIDSEVCISLEYDGTCTSCREVCELDAIDLDDEDEIVELNVGSIIVATGYDLMDPEKIYEYGYGKSKDIITNLELERIIDASGPTDGEIHRLSDGEDVESVTFILCVGSRDEELQSYCCRIGCMGALKHVHLLRDHLDEDVDINICYTDIRSFGKGYEEFYRRTRDLDVNFVRGRPSEVNVQEEKVELNVFDTTMDKLLQVESDLVVLVPALLPSEGTEELSRQLRITRSSDGFLQEAHPKLRPMDTFTNGIFIAGCCQGPKDIPDSVSQASGAAAKASTILSKDKLQSEATIASIDDDICSGCKMCISVCPYDAIEYNEEDEVAEITDVLCMGCGSCASLCPTGAIEHKGFKDEMLEAMIDAGLTEEEG